jgi:transposase
MSNKTSIDLQMFFPKSLKITEIIETEQTLIVHMKSLTHGQICPKCGLGMSKYHGTYERTVQDLPVFQKRVLLVITSYEYYCENEACKATTFTEDYEGFVGRFGRMTNRLEDFIRMLALETNCEGAAAICKEMNIKVSGDTIIRMLRKLNDLPLPPCGDTIGVDDFAYRKGHAYCTVICDVETHRPIEILDGRDGKTLREWLKKNKQVKKITRDRAGAYAKAISDELPEAMQIADRFHLYQNLLTAVKDALKAELPNKTAIPDTVNEMADKAKQEHQTAVEPSSQSPALAAPTSDCKKN